MAFTDAQRNQIVTYLGQPALAAGTRYAGYYPIYSQIDLIGGDPVTQAPVEAILVELAALDIVLATAGSTTNATGMLKAVDEVQFYNAQESAGIIAPGTLQRARMLVRRLAQRMGGEQFIIADYFAMGVSGGNSFQLSMG